MYFTYPEILSTIKRGWDRDLDDADRGLMDSVFGHGPEANKVRLLVVDDLGKEYKSTWSEGTFDHLLRERFDAGLPTIVTTNVPLKDWGTAYSPAMASFAHDAFYPVPLVYGGTGDRRKKPVLV
jgi:DNA replication protein DnaC